MTRPEEKSRISKADEFEAKSKMCPKFTFERARTRTCS